MTGALSPTGGAASTHRTGRAYRREQARMVSYTIDLLRHDGSIQETRIALLEHDDAAIDHVGGIDHPHSIDVWQGERHVALFPAWPWPTPFLPGWER